jgi:cyclic pyranopterin phosphate synthase
MERRKVDYLRFSVTDRCNLNCIYCRGFRGKPTLSSEEVLCYTDIIKIVRIFVRAGIRKLRLTGGEPLLREDIIDLINGLREIEGLEEITMTTNGTNLKHMVSRLKEAGLNRLNISLDTLDRNKYSSITGKDCFEEVWSGIRAALDRGLDPVKLNVVVMKGINEEEVLDFTQLIFKYPLSVRFIEFFPTGKGARELSHCLTRNSQIKKKISTRFGKMNHFTEAEGNGPASYYKLENAKGLIGFISNLSSNFCAECNRIRIDCAGRVSPCLFSGYVYDMGRMLKIGRQQEELLSEIKNIFKSKPRYNKKTAHVQQVEMSSIGG